MCRGLIISSLFGFIQSSWDYEHQPWNIGYCQGKTQSPINIDPSKTDVLVSDDIDSIHFLKTYIFENSLPSKIEEPFENQHSLRYSLNEEIGSESTKCVQIHFHFDTSEHFINNQFAFGEMHVVCYKTKYGDYDSAIESGEPDSIVVFGFQIDVDDDLDSTFNPEISSIISNKYTCQHAIRCDFEFSVPKPIEVSSFYRYYGSLTTPDCNEQVEWTIFTKCVPQLKMEKSLQSNFWPK